MMRRTAFVLGFLSAAACAGNQQQQKYDPSNQSAEGVAPEKRAAGGSTPDVEASKVKDYRDLEERAGESVTIEGIFRVYPTYKGRHGMIVMDSKLVVYLPHVEVYWKGEDWWRYDGRRCRVTGRVHAYGASIDGMKGPYLDEPTVPQILSNESGS